MSKVFVGALFVLAQMAYVPLLTKVTGGEKFVYCKDDAFWVKDAKGGFKKQPLVIKKGDSVVWVNEDKHKHDATPIGKTKQSLIMEKQSRFPPKGGNQTENLKKSLSRTPAYTHTNACVTPLI